MAGYLDVSTLIQFAKASWSHFVSYFVDQKPFPGGFSSILGHLPERVWSSPDYEDWRSSMLFEPSATSRIASPQNAFNFFDRSDQDVFINITSLTTH
jgi:hypothetical protein